MTSPNPVNRNRRSVSAFLVLLVLAAGLATAAATPAGASANLAAAQHNEWHTEVDDPTLHPSPLSGGNWRFGGSTDHGNGPAIYYEGQSNFTYLDHDFNPANHWAEWDMGHHYGTQEIQLFIPKLQANAQIRYRILDGSTWRWTTPVIRQIKILNGWHSIGNHFDSNGRRIRIQVHWEDSSQDPEARTWLLGIDTARMRCVSNCTSRPNVPVAMLYGSGKKWNSVPGATSYDISIWDGTREEISTGHGCCGESLGFLYGTERYRVRAVNSAGASGWSDWVQIASVPVVPAVPSGLQFSSGRVMWGSVSGATSYDVRVCTNDGCVTHREIDCCEWRYGDGPFNSIRVRAMNSAGHSDWSTRVDGPIVEVPEPQPPSPPRNVNAVAHGQQQVRVTWSPPSDSGSSAIKHYTVRYSRGSHGDDPPWRSRLYTTTSTSHTSPNLRRGVTYTVTVTAVNRDGRTSRSVSDTATTRTRATTAPSPPRNVNAVAHGQQQVRVTWSPPSDSGSSAIKHYTVRYSRGSHGDDPPWRSRLYTTTSTSHTSPNLRRGVTYTVTVTAVNRDGRTSRSVSDTATTRTRATTAPSPPRNVNAVAHGQQQVRVTWSPPSDSGSSAIKHYTVRYSRGSHGDDPPWRSRLYTTTSTSHTSPNLRRGVTYTVTVTAVNRDGRTSRSVTDTATTRTRATTEHTCRWQQCERRGARTAAGSGHVVAAVGLRQLCMALHMRYSRGSDGDDPPWRSRLYTTTSTSRPGPDLRRGVTYTAVTAVNPTAEPAARASDTANSSSIESPQETRGLTNGTQQTS